MIRNQIVYDLVSMVLVVPTTLKSFNDGSGGVGQDDYDGVTIAMVMLMGMVQIRMMRIMKVMPNKNMMCICVCVNSHHPIPAHGLDIQSFDPCVADVKSGIEAVDCRPAAKLWCHVAPKPKSPR